MKRSLGAAAGLATFGVVFMWWAHAAQAQNSGNAARPVAAGSGPAQLKDPFLESLQPAAPIPGVPNATPFLPGQRGPDSVMPAAALPRQESQQQDKDPNQDILVQPDSGAWMIYVHWYTGPEAPQMARAMVMELRQAYKLPAYVFNHGAEERRKEDERVRAIVEKQRQFFEKNNLPMPDRVRVHRMHIEEQCAILVGGYSDREAARRTLEKIRKLPPPDPQKVKLATMFYQENDDKTNSVQRGEMVYVNPFTKAFVVRNPSIKVARPAEWEKQDMALLRKLNRSEPYSMLQCKKPFTLVIKQFNTPSVLQSQSASGKFLENLGLGKNNGVDTAATNAHNLAQLLRKSFNLEAYVLHTRFNSIVSIGGFESADDPNLRSTRDLLTSRLKIPAALPMRVPQ
jgi:hypothetical protein